MTAALPNPQGCPSSPSSSGWQGLRKGGPGRLCGCVGMFLSFSAVPEGVKRPGEGKAQLERKLGECGGSGGGSPAPAPWALLSLVKGGTSGSPHSPSHLPAGHPEAWAGQGAGRCPQERRCCQLRKREADISPGMGRDAGGREARSLRPGGISGTAGPRGGQSGGHCVPRAGRRPCLHSPHRSLVLGTWCSSRLP